jgi:predicted DsbA family dithiol-disulfide isomerase
MVRALVTAFLLILPMSAANAGPSFYVVEIANFACAHCRAMDPLVPSLIAATTAAGGEFDFAPLVWDGQPEARDMVYYAARQQGPDVAAAVRTSLFKGIQDNNLPFEDVAQVDAWLQQDVPVSVGIDYDQLARDLNTDVLTHLPEAKTARLAKAAGVSATPTFVFIKDGVVVTTLTAAPSDSAYSLAEKVKAELKPKQN